MTVDVRFVIYVDGESPSTTDALSSLRDLCREREIPDTAIEVIDVRRLPERADTDRVLATPTIIRTHPPPPVRVIGDIATETSEAERLLFGGM